MNVYVRQLRLSLAQNDNNGIKIHSMRDMDVYECSTYTHSRTHTHTHTQGRSVDPLLICVMRGA